MSTPSPLPPLLLTEAILKLIGGSIFFISPTTILKNLHSPPYPLSSISLIQSLGTQTIAFSIPLFLAARADSASVKSRRIVYWAVLGREGLLGAGLLAQIGWSWVGEWKRGKERSGDGEFKALEEGRAAEKRWGVEDENLAATILRRGLWMWVAELVPFVVGRMWILRYRREWFD
ncbi:hypothetical protein BCR34DRAFT_574610 [Clohesyomyces aquaticus]|uniref:Uncharacterized protein n=1 Tax=Clohesyomyces aquaticus TaxID=1231657 RepID=A0A1Y1YV40_9PLEO|nr:hypothetical protein BCR34DRAFT_574610 [Clohesyomyces aquaticus]